MHFFSSILFFFIICFNFQAADNSQLSFEDLCIRNKAQVDLLQSLHCRVVSENNIYLSNGKNSSSKREGEFWFVPGQIKAKIADAKFNQEYTWKKSILRGLSITAEPGTNQPLYSANSTSTPTRYVHNLDPFIVGLLVVNPPESVNGTPLSQVLNESVVVKKIEKKTDANATYILLTLHFKPNSELGRKNDWTVELYFDPSVNYLIKKAVFIQNNTNFRRVEEITSFKEQAKRLFFPTECTNRSFNGTKLTRSTITNFTDVSINEEIPDDIFSLRFPHGILFIDNVNRTTYHIDENGEPFTDPIPQGRKEIPPPSNNSTNTVVKFPTQNETISPTWWILPISSLLAVLCLIWIYFQKKRSGK